VTDLVSRRGAAATNFSAVRVVGAAALLVALAGAPLALGQYALGFALSLCMSVALAESWLLLSGLTGYISLGHAVFFGLGAYVMALSLDYMPFWLAIPLAGAAAGLLALVLGYPALKVRGPYFVILTFGLAELVKFVVIAVESGLGNSSRILMEVPDLATLYELMLALAVASFCLVWVIQRSRFGAGLRAIRADESAAETIGVNVGAAKVAAFALSAVIPGAVGAVMAMRSSYFEPAVAFSPIVSFTIVTTAMIGGSDTPMGPLLGALLLGLASELLWAHAPQIYNILLGCVLVFFVVRVPEGLYGKLSAWSRRLEGGIRERRAASSR
jgi:branched-chain amino acid transport system permease protein